MAPSSLSARVLGQQGLYASAQGLGCMSLSAGYYHDSSTLGPEENRIAVIHTALSNHVTLLSTADFYGPYDNHSVIGKFLQPVNAADATHATSSKVVAASANKCNLIATNSLCVIFAAKAIKDTPRDKVVIASKWGPMMVKQGQYKMDYSPEYCRKSLMESLKRLGVEYIDLYIMRSKDQNTPIEDSVKAMSVSNLIVATLGALVGTECHCTAADCFQQLHTCISARVQS